MRLPSCPGGGRVRPEEFLRSAFKILDIALPQGDYDKTKALIFLTE